MAKNTTTVQGFLGSLILLVVALAVFFIVLFPKPRHHPSHPEGVSGGQEQAAVAESAEKLRRQSLRSQSAGSASAAKLAKSQEETVAANDTASFGPEGASGGPSAEASAGLAGPAGAEGEDMGTGAPGSEGQPPAGSADPEVQQAIALIDAGNVNEATGLLESVLKRDPKNEAALVELAMVQLLDLKQPEQAVGYLQRAVEVNPGNQMVLSELVSLYEEQGRMDEGLNFLMDATSKNPDSPGLAYGVGQMLTLQGREQDAIPYLEKATHSPDTQGRAFRDLAETYARTGEAEKAVDFYNKAIQSQEKEISEKAARGMPVTYSEERLGYTKMDKATVLMQAGDLEQAQALLEEVSVALPNNDQLTALQESLKRKRAG